QLAAITGKGVSAQAEALKTMIASVSTLPRAERVPSTLVPSTASGWMALSYAHQATNNLPDALDAAKEAARMSPEFGFAWARVAELEFSFGNTRPARRAVEKALRLSPNNAQAHSVRGFLLAADGNVREAL